LYTYRGYYNMYIFYMHQEAFYKMGTGGSFPGGKSRPARDADHSPPSSPEVKKDQELYILLPKCASMERNGTTLPFLPFMHHGIKGRFVF
jgi:hypothetical protein